MRRLRPGVAAVHDTIVPFRAAWERQNQTDRHGDGPLWLVLGDSTAQAIGAATPDRGYVGQVRSLLEARDERRWRVVNAAAAGARLRDVLAGQLAWLDALAVPPDLVTCSAGANDLVWRPGLRRARRDVTRVLGALPSGAVIATLPKGLSAWRAVVVNDDIRAQAPARGLVVADVWAHTGPPWSGKLAVDHFHPNERGYQDWTVAFAEALGLVIPPDGDPPSPRGGADAR